MKRGTRGYGIMFLLFLILVIIIRAQNLTGAGNAKFLWTETSTTTIILLVGFFGLLQGAFLVIFIREFFTSMQKSELSKFDLDKPL